MTMTDPIADMLTRIRNASQAYHETATMPHSKIKVGIAEILANEGYIASYDVNEPARTASARLPAYAASRSPGFGCTQSQVAFPRCSAV
jgi:ribosomal protein S8